MILRQLKVTADNFCYIVGDEKSGECAVIDPSSGCDRILSQTEDGGLRVLYVICTHGHPDHTGCSGAISKETGAKVALHELSKARKDIALKDGQVLGVGAVDLKIIHTPGHTADSICVLAGGKALFTGDTLFVGECGRADLPGSSVDALWKSLFEKLASLPDGLKVYPGHDYGPRPTSTLGEERRTNYTLKPRSLDEFVEFMEE